MPSLVMDFLQGIAQPFETLGKGLINTPEAIARELQNKPITDIQQKTFGTTNQGQIARDIVASTANVGLDIAAPGIGRAAAGATGAADLTGVAGGAVKGVVEGAAIGGTQNVAQGVGSTQPLNAKNLTLDFLQGAGTGAALGGAVGGAVPATKLLAANATSLNEAGGINNLKASAQFSQEDLQKMANNTDHDTIAKQLEPVTGKVVAQEIAPAVAKATDPHVAANIIDNNINNKIPTPDTTGVTNPSPALPTTTPTTPVSNINTPQQVAGEGEQAAADYMQQNKDQVMKDYQAKTMQEFSVDKPNIVSADTFKYIVPGETGNTVHEPFSQAAKDYYKDLLADNSTKDKPVLITAGGTGAGKTTGLRLLNGSLNDYAAVNDTNLSSLSAATSRIDPALASGRKVRILYTYRDPVDAFTNGNLKRAANPEDGRVAPIVPHVDTSIGSLDTMKQVVQKYKDNPNVDIQIADNSRGAKNATLVPSIDSLGAKAYNKDELTERLLDELQQAHAQGKVSSEAYEKYQEGLGTRNRGQPQQERPSDQVEPPFINIPGEVRQMSTVMQEGAKQVPQKGLTESVQASPNFSPELKENIGSQKNLITNAVTNANTQEFMKQGIDSAHSDVLSRLQSGQRINAQLTSDAGAVMQHFDALGKTPEASNIHQLLREGLEEQGQGAQAARLVLSRTPEGLYYDATNTLSKNGSKISPEVDTKLQDLKNELKNTIPGTPEYAKGVQDMGKIVRDNTPSTLGEQAFGIWRAGLLTSSQILPKIATSHLVQAGAELAAKAVAAPIDAFISNFGFSTGERSLSATLRGGEGVGTGISKAKALVTKGEDTGIGSNSQADFGHTINYGNSLPGKFLGAYVNGVGRLHGAIYQPFAEYFHANSLWDQAITRAKNQGLQGEEKDRFLVDFMHSPPSDAMEIALHDAKVGSFQQETQLGKIASTIQQKGGPLGKVVAPFTKIPSAIATDLFNYSPAGAMKTIMDGIKAAKTEEGWSIADQRNFAQGLGRSIVGTAALVPGIMLYNRAMMTLGYPTDTKEQQLWQDEGKIPNAVKIGGQWRSLASLGPMGNVLSMGGGIADSLVQGKDIGTALINGMSVGAQSIAQASYLQGTSQAINTINDPQKNATTFVKSLAGSVVPALSNSVAGATDQYQRQTTGDNLVSSALQSIKSRIPGERETLAPKVDAFGNPLKSGETGLEKIVDPFASSAAATPSPLLTELRRLENAGFGEMPTAVTKKENLGSSKQPIYVNLTRAQMQQLTTAIGQNTEGLWAQAINDPSYSTMTDMQKQALLSSLYGSAASQGKNIIAQQYQLGPFAQNLQQALQQSRQKRPQVV